MDYIGGVMGMNFTPITNYNKQLKEAAAFDIDSGSDFENILNKQISAGQDAQKINGGIEMNSFDEMFAKTAVQTTQDSNPVGSFLDNLSSGVSKGLSSVNQNMTAAQKAQEAFAMGEDVSVHDVMIATEKASLSLQMAMQLRNKMVNAYNEINGVRV